MLLTLQGASTRSSGPEEPAGPPQKAGPSRPVPPRKTGKAKVLRTAAVRSTLLMEGRGKAAIPLLYYGGKGNSLS